MTNQLVDFLTAHHVALQVQVARQQGNEWLKLMSAGSGVAVAATVGATAPVVLAAVEGSAALYVGTAAAGVICSPATIAFIFGVTAFTLAEKDVFHPVKWWLTPKDARRNRRP